jgi:hypothetical protein
MRKRHSFDEGLGLPVFFSAATIFYIWFGFTDQLGEEKPFWVAPLGFTFFGLMAIASWRNFILKSPDTLKAKVEPVIAKIGMGVLLIWFLFFGLAWVVVPLFQQIGSWLQFGAVPDRDLYWFLADSFCDRTGWVGQGWEGKDICRDPSNYETGWVGLDSIIDFVMNMHVAFLFAICSAALFALSVYIATAFDPR